MAKTCGYTQPYLVDLPYQASRNGSVGLVYLLDGDYCSVDVGNLREDLTGYSGLKAVLAF
ncbi:hypothetical protein DPMN_128004 [Dreissena polymorpha]|uniref:Uncharacterized protein n=1 Tax=Dreissena polymorpha TaxID=45954 RepID=A0A9D4GYM4_DREPO|nr:hypothetical protein DPMN_128004 [Dreissena polymorpha]